LRLSIPEIIGNCRSWLLNVSSAFRYHVQDLLQQPLWQPEDLGKPLPASLHATSVCMPTWQDVIDYEEGTPRVLDRLYCGYPRFFPHSRTAALFDEATRNVAQANERALVFPCYATALRCQEYVERSFPASARVLRHAMGEFSVLLAQGSEAFLQARRYWRFSGEVIASRQACLLLEGCQPASRVSAHEDATPAHREVRERVAHYARRKPDDVYLFPSGMAGVFAVHRMLRTLWPGLPTVQVDFPYVDVLKVQREFGAAEPIFLPDGSEPELSKLQARIDAGLRIAGIFGEVPSNPLLRCVNTLRLRQIADLADVALVLDDTISTSVNVDVASVADVVTTSLTKSFSGAGDVLAGSVLLNRDSPHYERMREFLRRDAPVGLCSEDAAVLAENSRDYEQRVLRSNVTGSEVADFLSRHAAIERVWYPSLTTPEHYSGIARSNGGWGGLLSFSLRGGEAAAARCYDRMRICKGPSLGTNFSLACPYTLLAHYDELAWAQAIGVPRDLIRFSVGQEKADDLIERLADSLA
jgi:cystathionine gamma-synthase